VTSFHCSGSLPNRFENPHVASAAAQITVQTLTNLIRCGMGISVEQMHCGQNHPWSADAALSTAAFKECLLHGMQSRSVAKALDCYNTSATGLGDRNEAAIY